MLSPSTTRSWWPSARGTPDWNARNCWSWCSRNSTCRRCTSARTRSWPRTRTAGRRPWLWTAVRLIRARFRCTTVMSSHRESWRVHWAVISSRCSAGNSSKRRKSSCRLPAWSRAKASFSTTRRVVFSRRDESSSTTATGDGRRESDGNDIIRRTFKYWLQLTLAVLTRNFTCYKKECLIRGLERRLLWDTKGSSWILSAGILNDERALCAEHLSRNTLNAFIQQSRAALPHALSRLTERLSTLVSLLHQNLFSSNIIGLLI